MRVLIFTQYFTPEVGATQTRVHTFAAGLAALGHEVEVVCEVPNHPQGIVHPEFRGRAVLRRRMDGFRVLYTWVRATPVKTTRSRLYFYGSYAGMAVLTGATRPRPDVVLASSPPLPVAAAAAAVAARHRVPWVFDVRDLWPAAAVALGELSNPRLLRLAEALEIGLYRHASAITAVTEPFRRSIAERLGDAGKVSVLPNGTTRLWVDGAAVEGDRAALGLDDGRFLWTFAGNVGTAQGLEAAVRAAALLGDGFRLLILGDGPARTGLEELAARSEGTVEFRSQVPATEALRYLRSSDALLVSLGADPALADFVPSKLYDCCAVGRPVVLAAAGEPQRLTGEREAALGVAPGDAEALAGAVRRLRDDPALGDRLATQGRAFGAANLRANQVNELARILDRVVRPIALVR